MKGDASMKQAQIKCPHCGSEFIVRQVEIADPEHVEKVWKAADEAFKAIDAAMDKAFRAIRSVWK